MFVGHFGLGFAGKRVAPRVSLATWFLSVQLVDLLWPLFLLLGWEHVRIAPGDTRMTPLDFYDYPLTHSLAGALAWSVLFAGLYLLYARGRRRPDGRPSAPATAALLGAGVLSHWFLDLVVHRPDLPILPGGLRLGLGLWNHPAIAFPLEAALYLGGAALYLRSTRPRDAVGRWATWLLLLVLPALWLIATLGPPPSDPRTLAWSGLVMWLFIPWAGWCDRHREPHT